MNFLNIPLLLALDWGMVYVLEHETLSATKYYWFNPGRPAGHDWKIVDWDVKNHIKGLYILREISWRITVQMK